MWPTSRDVRTKGSHGTLIVAPSALLFLSLRGAERHYASSGASIYSHSTRRNDVISRRSYMELRPRELAFELKKQVLLGPNRLRLMAANAKTTLEDSALLDSIRDHIPIDEFANDVLDHIARDRASCW